MARLAVEAEIKRQPPVISKRPIITPFERALSIPKFSKSPVSGEKIPMLKRTSPIIKKIVI